MREKVAGFVRKYGYTYNSMAISTIVCPLAAVYIACRKPSIGVTQRIVLILVGLLTVPVLTAVIVYLAGQAASFFFQSHAPATRG